MVLRVFLRTFEHSWSLFSVILGKNTTISAIEAEKLAKLLQSKLQALDASHLQINEQTNRLIHARTTWAELKVCVLLLELLPPFSTGDQANIAASS